MLAASACAVTSCAAKKQTPFVHAEAIKPENLGNRAERIDGALAEDAIRATDLLRGHKITIHDAARFAADAAEKLAPHGATIGNAVDFYIRAMQRRTASVSISALIDEFLKNRTAKGKCRAYVEKDELYSLRRKTKSWDPLKAGQPTFRSIQCLDPRSTLPKPSWSLLLIVYFNDSHTGAAAVTSKNRRVGPWG